MRFFKDNIDTVVKLIVNQIGVAIFAFFLYTAAGAISVEPGVSLTIKIAISVFAILFYLVLIYNIAWEIGAKDKIKIDGKRLTRTPNKGILIGLMANSLNFIVIAAALIMMIIYIFTSSDALYSAFAVLNFIFRFFISMYLGVIQGICSPFAADQNLYYLAQTIGFFVFSALSALAIHISYIMGLNDWRLIPATHNKNNHK